MSDVYEMMMLLEAHIANDMNANVINDNANEDMMMTNTNANVVADVVVTNVVTNEANDMHTNTTVHKFNYDDQTPEYKEYIDMLVQHREALNAMSLNYLWSILDEEAYIGSDGSYDPQHYAAIVNIIDDYTVYINEMLWLEQAEDHHCGGIFWEAKDLPIMAAPDAQQLMEWIQEFNEDFMRDAYSKDYNHIIFQRGTVVPF